MKIGWNLVGGLPRSEEVLGQCAHLMPDQLVVVNVGMVPMVLGSLTVESRLLKAESKVIPGMRGSSPQRLARWK